MMDQFAGCLLLCRSSYKITNLCWFNELWCHLVWHKNFMIPNHHSFVAKAFWHLPSSLLSILASLKCTNFNLVAIGCFCLTQLWTIVTFLFVFDLKKIKRNFPHIICYVAIIEVIFSNGGKERLKFRGLGREKNWTSVCCPFNHHNRYRVLFCSLSLFFFWWSKPDFQTNFRVVNSGPLPTLLPPELQPLGWKWSALATRATSLVICFFLLFFF